MDREQQRPLCEWYADHQWSGRMVRLYARTAHPQHGDKLVVFRHELRADEPGTMAVADDAALTLHRDEVQQLLDQFWRLGFRPRDGAGALAHVDAQAAHIADLRTVVLRLLPAPPSTAPGANDEIERARIG